MTPDSPKTLDEDSRPLPPVVAALWSIAASLLVGLLVALLESLREGAAEDLVTVTFCFAAGYLGCMSIMLRVHAPRASLRSLLALSVPSPTFLGLSLLAGAGLGPGLCRLSEWLEHLVPAAEGLVEQETTLLTAHSPAAVVFRFLSQVVVFPVVYGLFFRGMLIGGMRRTRSDDVALVMSAMFFAFRDQASIPPMLLLGLVTGWVRIKSESTIASILVHVAAMFVWLWPIRSDVDFNADSGFAVRTIVAGTVVGLAALFAMGRLARKAATPSLPG